MTNTFKADLQASSKKWKGSTLRFGQIQSQTIWLLLIFIASCGEPDQTPRAVSTPQNIGIEASPAPSVQPEMNVLMADPTFVMSKDTIATYGPQSITRSVLLDSKDKLWFASWQGIIRYDGTSFTNFTLQEGLRHFHVFSILEDKNGNLWFGTIGGGLYRYDGKSFTLFTTAEGLAGNAVLCMMEDNLGNIWFGTGEGVSRYDGQTFTNFTTEIGLSSNSINAITQDKTGNIWIGSQNGLCRYDGNTFVKFTKEKSLPFYNVRSVLEDKAGIIWIGSEDGLYRYNGKSLTQLTTNFTGYIFEDKKGMLWLSESKSNVPGMTVSRYDGKTFKVIAKSTQVFGITEDRSGNIWFCTANGVGRYDGKSINYFTDTSK
jgi:ligand-binding sensor domain-containing protein